MLRLHASRPPIPETLLAETREKRHPMPGASGNVYLSFPGPSTGQTLKESLFDLALFLPGGRERMGTQDASSYAVLWSEPGAAPFVP